MSPKSVSKVRRTTLILVFLTIFLDLIGFGLFIPILANIARTFDATSSQAAALSAWFSLGTLVASLVLGRLSDQMGRKKILVATIMVSAMAQIATGFATSYLYLVICRLVAGLASGNISVAQAAIADVTVPKDRSRAMIVIGLAFGLGFAIGPALGGVIARLFPDNYLMVIGLTAGLLNIINLIAVQRKLPETHHKFFDPKIKDIIDEVKLAQADQVAVKRPIREDLGRLLAEKGFTPLLAMQFIQMFGFVGVETIMPLALKDAYQLSDSKIFDLFTIMGITIILTNGGIARPLLKRFGEFTTLNIGQFIVMASIAAIPFFAPNTNAITFILIAMSAGSALFNPAITSLVSRLAPTDIQGFALGANQSMASAARLLGPIFMGLMYQFFFQEKSLYLSALFLFLAATFSVAGLWKIRSKFQPEAAV
jgi:DHA1 family tetracycline resistance protein-like MFS transporter